MNCTSQHLYVREAIYCFFIILLILVASSGYPDVKNSSKCEYSVLRNVFLNVVLLLSVIASFIALYFLINYKSRRRAFFTTVA